MGGEVQVLDSAERARAALPAVDDEIAKNSQIIADTALAGVDNQHDQRADAASVELIRLRARREVLLQALEMALADERAADAAKQRKENVRNSGRRTKAGGAPSAPIWRASGVLAGRHPTVSPR